MLREWASATISAHWTHQIGGIFFPLNAAKVDGATQSGLGLGLYIVRRLAAALDGTVTLESRVGIGSRFTVRIPLTTPAPERVQPGADPRS